ncbi:hypothetical protein [Limnohabitans sp.]|uniref:hypothetical protein n=1 Tax=Limnohabitans sp. TaxID=1907725 RepID=UPI0025C6C3BA|nr:hypothetical protein [Limnohabitans sp.]
MTQRQDKHTNVLIVDQPFDADGNETPFGQRWGGERFTLTPEHLAALQAGKTIALDVMNEYVVFLKLGDGV